MGRLEIGGGDYRVGLVALDEARKRREEEMRLMGMAQENQRAQQAFTLQSQESRRRAQSADESRDLDFMKFAQDQQRYETERGDRLSDRERGYGYRDQEFDFRKSTDQRDFDARTKERADTVERWDSDRKYKIESDEREWDSRKEIANDNRTARTNAERERAAERDERNAERTRQTALENERKTQSSAQMRYQFERSALERKMQNAQALAGTPEGYQAMQEIGNQIDMLERQHARSMAVENNGVYDEAGTGISAGAEGPAGGVNGLLADANRKKIDELKARQTEQDQLKKDEALSRMDAKKKADVARLSAEAQRIAQKGGADAVMKFIASRDELDEDVRRAALSENPTWRAIMDDQAELESLPPVQREAALEKKMKLLSNPEFLDFAAKKGIEIGVLQRERQKLAATASNYKSKWKGDQPYNGATTGVMDYLSRAGDPLQPMPQGADGLGENALRLAKGANPMYWQTRAAGSLYDLVKDYIGN